MIDSPLKASDIRLIEDLFEMKSGYVLDFSDRTFVEFFQDELEVDIGNERWSADGTSKANRLRCYLRTGLNDITLKALTALWEYRQAQLLREGREDTIASSEALFAELTERLGGRRKVKKTHSESADQPVSADPVSPEPEIPPSIQKPPNKKSSARRALEIAAAIVAIAAGLVAIYEFALSNGANDSLDRTEKITNLQVEMRSLESDLDELNQEIENKQNDYQSRNQTIIAFQAQRQQLLSDGNVEHAERVLSQIRELQRGVVSVTADEFTRKQNLEYEISAKTKLLHSLQSGPPTD